MKGGGGEPVTYGIRLKDSEIAAQVGTCTVYRIDVHTSIVSCDSHMMWCLYVCVCSWILQLNDRITEVLNAMMSKPPEVKLIVASSPDPIFQLIIYIVHKKAGFENWEIGPGCSSHELG